jgi:hypothetical protein
MKYQILNVSTTNSIIPVINNMLKIICSDSFHYYYFFSILLVAVAHAANYNIILTAESIFTVLDKKEHFFGQEICYTESSEFLLVLDTTIPL